MVRFWKARYVCVAPWQTGNEGHATVEKSIHHVMGHDPEFLVWTLTSGIKLRIKKGSTRELKGLLLKRVCARVCASQRASPDCKVDKKGQREARGYPLLTGCLWRAGEAAPESGLMVEMDAQSPCGVILFMASVHPWYMERRQMPARAIADEIGEILLRDAEAECSFELVPRSRVMPGVIECCCAPTGEERDENLFSASLLEELCRVLTQSVEKR